MLGQFGKLGLLLDHLLTQNCLLFVGILNENERSARNAIKEEKVENAEENDEFESCVGWWEKTDHGLNRGVGSFAFDDHGRDVLHHSDLLNAKHDAKTHPNPISRLLLLRGQRSIHKGNEKVEAY